MTENPQYEKIGNMFRLGRESRAVELERVSQDLYIRARYLRSLESGKFHELPGPAYVKGYLLAYANYLHMDEQEVLRQFHAIDADFRRNHYFPKVLGDEKDARGWVVLVGLLVAVSAIGLWIGSYYMPGRHIAVQDIDAWRQQLLKKGHVSAFSAKYEACFQELKQLYPPCYAREPHFYLLPLKRRSVSVMEIM